MRKRKEHNFEQQGLRPLSKTTNVRNSNVIPLAEPDRTNCSVLKDMIDRNAFSTVFQPIVSLDGPTVHAHEALCRTTGPNPFETIDNLFHQARLHNLTFELDMLCRKNSMYHAAQHGLRSANGLLFVNICPTSLLAPGHSAGTTKRLAAEHGILKEQIVLEITEQEAVSNYGLFRKSVDHYRDCGFRIAIDDFGAGYGGLKMLSILEPDYVKIDRHFFRSPERSHINYNLIDAIATACHRIGIDVIAEGIETEKEVKLCREMGICYLQGYFFARPEPFLADSGIIPNIKNIPTNSTTTLFDEVICVGDICTWVDPVAHDSRALDILERFNATPEIDCLPVLENNRLCGMINRQRFMEEQMVGRYGYGLNLNYYKTVEDLLDGAFLQVPDYTTVEDVARRIQSRSHMSLYDDICITRSGKYVGTVSVSDILNAVTENSMMIARGANPLTGLPGNEFIQRQIARMLAQSIHFDVCYIDIDSFKPFNDYHGFDMGDKVIKEVGNILQESVKKWDKSEVSFAGHIGGDDFIIICRPKHSIQTCRDIIEKFSVELHRFHSEQSCNEGFYYSIDRQGNKKRFNLLSLSIGIVSTEIHHTGSIAEISSIASELKKKAKSIPGSVIVRDRRGAAILP